MANYTYPQSAGAEKLAAFIQFTEYEKGPSNSYTFYMPEKLINPNTISWDSERLGLIAGVANDFASGDQGLGTGLYNVGEGMLTRAGFNLASGIAQQVSASASVSTLMGLSGKIANPYLVMLFRGVDFRSFEFTFKMYPHTQKEVTNIHEIVTSLRKASLPTGNSGSPVLGYPNEFTIEYLFENGPNKWLNKFKKCVIVGIDVDYTSTGMWTMTRDGFPSEITLHLRFSEVELVLRDDVAQGY